MRSVRRWMLRSRLRTPDGDLRIPSASLNAAFARDLAVHATRVGQPGGDDDVLDVRVRKADGREPDRAGRDIVETIGQEGHADPLCTAWWPLGVSGDDHLRDARLGQADHVGQIADREDDVVIVAGCEVEASVVHLVRVRRQIPASVWRESLGRFRRVIVVAGNHRSGLPGTSIAIWSSVPAENPDGDGDPRPVLVIPRHAVGESRWSQRRRATFASGAAQRPSHAETVLSIELPWKPSETTRSDSVDAE